MNAININPHDIKNLNELMDTYGNSETSFFGETEEGETCLISICPTNIVIEVFQDNNWGRKTTYYRDGTSEVTYTPPEV